MIVCRLVDTKASTMFCKYLCLSYLVALTTSSVEDKSVRYVAEENIEPVSLSVAEVPEMLMAIAGKHFKRWDEETRTFVSNIRDEYPDD